MTLCDANVWLALALSEHVHHAVAVDWLAEIEQPASVCFCRATQQTLLRLLTHEAVLRPYGNPPLSNARARAAYEAFLEDDRIVLRDSEPPGLEPLWQRFASVDSASPKLWMDAYLAAFAVSGGHRLVTTDQAFNRFPGLDLELLECP